MKILSALRRMALLVVVAAIVAGCAAPPEENRPGDLNCDGDRDGIPDGQSPVEGANETCPTEGGEQDTSGMPANDTSESAMPGLLP